MSEDSHASSDADLSPNVVKTANVLPGPNMLSNRLKDTGAAETNISPSSVIFENDSFQSTSPRNEIGASARKVLPDKRALRTARRRSPRTEAKSRLTKTCHTEQMDGANYSNSEILFTIGELAVVCAENVDGNEAAQVQHKMTTSGETTASREESHIADGEAIKAIENSPKDSKILLELAKSTDPGNLDSDSQKAGDDIDRNDIPQDDKRSESVNDDKEKACVSQVKRCPYCVFEYRGPRDLAPHVKESHGAQFINSSGRVGYKCLYCNESNTRPRNLRKHMHVSHPDHFSVEDLHHTLKFRCTEEGCAKSFCREAKLRSHLISEHGRQKPQLARGKVYDLGKMRERAERVEKREQPTWGQRSTETKNKPSSIHTQSHKSSRLRDCHEECWRKARDGTNFSCFYCNKTFTHHSMCVGHERTHENKNKHAKDGFTCEHCNETFSTTDLLKQHRQSAHETSAGDDNHETSAGDDNRLSAHKPSAEDDNCQSAHKTSAKDDKSQSGHKASAGDDNRCPLCEKSFASPYYIKLHVEAVHDKKAKYVCTDCGKSYLHKNGLNSHRENYHNPAPRPRGSKPARFKCTVCDVSLTSHCGMRAHMNKHNGVRPYACRHCDRSFTSMNHRTAHESIHSGVKAHRCPICYKVFTNVGTLYNHLYRYKVHGVVPRGSLSAHSSNVDTLLRAAELCQQPQPAPRKTPRPIRPKPSRKAAPSVPDVSPQEEQVLVSIATPAAPPGQLPHVATSRITHSEQLALQEHDAASSLSENITTDPDQSSSAQVEVGEALWMMSQNIDDVQTQVVIESEPSPAVLPPAGDAQLNSLGAEQYVTLLQDGSQLADSHMTLLQGGSQLADGHVTLLQNGSQLSNGHMTLLQGGSQLADGHMTLLQGGSQLTDGHMTLLQGGSQLADGQEISIVTIEDHCPSSDGNITIPSGQQVAFIIMPQQDESQTVGDLTEKVYIQINMESGCGEHGVEAAQWSLGQELAADRMVDYHMPMDGVEYVTEQTGFSTVTASSIHE